jgi:hypothetical protein
MNQKSFLFAVIVLFSIVTVNAQPLFSISQNNLPKAVVSKLLTQIEKSETSVLALAKNYREKDIYPVDFLSGENTLIIIMNVQAGTHVVLTPVAETWQSKSLPAEFQLAPFYIEELRLGALGDAALYLVAITDSDYSVKKVTSISTSNGDGYIPRYFYGQKENVQEALPKDRQITGITKKKPHYISAFPDDPEMQLRIAQMEEAASYYLYIFKLPDGTVCTYDENLNPTTGSSNANTGSPNRAPKTDNPKPLPKPKKP